MSHLLALCLGLSDRKHNMPSVDGMGQGVGVLGGNAVTVWMEPKVNICHYLSHQLDSHSLQGPIYRLF